MSEIKYTFREANNDDKVEILKLYKSAVGTEGCTWSEDYPNENICSSDIDRHDLFCMEDVNGSIIAAISVDLDDKVDSLGCWKRSVGRMAELSRLVVRKEYQNRGLAPELINEVIDILKTRGYKTVHYLVSKYNMKALASYKKLDFTKVGECNLFGEEWYCYEKSLETNQSCDNNSDSKSYKIFTIPNVLSFFRIILAGLFLMLYSNKAGLRENIWAVLVLIVSGITDFLDGRIARKYNMVSEIGKILDPIADKVTEAVIALCLITKYKIIILMLIVFVIKELFMSICGVIVVKKMKKNDGARWYGKVSTFFFYITMITLLIIPKVPVLAADILIILCTVIMMFSFVMYVRLYYGLLKGCMEE